MPKSLKNHKLARARKDHIQSFKAKMDARRSPADKAADVFTKSFGTVIFLVLNGLWFMIWILINMGFIPAIPAFDPFPFGLLTMIVSLEAIFLSIIVLISQNRAARIADLREEVDLHINVRAEEEITRLICMVDMIHDHLGLEAADDVELIRMKQKINLEELETQLEKEV